MQAKEKGPRRPLLTILVFLCAGSQTLVVSPALVLARVCTGGIGQFYASEKRAWLNKDRLPCPDAAEKVTVSSHATCLGEKRKLALDLSGVYIEIPVLKVTGSLCIQGCAVYAKPTCSSTGASFRSCTCPNALFHPTVTS